MAASWEAACLACESAAGITVLEQETVDAVKTYCIARKLLEPSALRHTTMAELDDDKHTSYPKDVAARSLLRRLVFWSIQARETEEHEAKMKRLDALNVASQNAAQSQRQPASGTPLGQMWQPQPSQVSNVNEAALTALLGNDASALAVAAHMGSADNTKVVIQTSSRGATRTRCRTTCRWMRACSRSCMLVPRQGRRPFRRTWASWLLFSVTNASCLSGCRQSRSAAKLSTNPRTCRCTSKVAKRWPNWARR